MCIHVYIYIYTYIHTYLKGPPAHVRLVQTLGWDFPNLEQENGRMRGWQNQVGGLSEIRLARRSPLSRTRERPEGCAFIERENYLSSDMYVHVDIHRVVSCCFIERETASGTTSAAFRQPLNLGGTTCLTPHLSNTASFVF